MFGSSLPPVVCRRVHVTCVCLRISGVKHVLNIWVTRRMSNKRQDLFTLREHMGSSPDFGGVHVLPFASTWVHTRILVESMSYPSRAHGFIPGLWWSPCLTLREPLGSSPGFGGVHVAYLFCFLYCVVFLYFACIRPASCMTNVVSVSDRPASCMTNVVSVSELSILDWPMLSVSLNCQFLIDHSLIDHSVFSWLTIRFSIIWHLMTGMLYVWNYMYTGII